MTKFLLEIDDELDLRLIGAAVSHLGTTLSRAYFDEVYEEAKQTGRDMAVIDQMRDTILGALEEMSPDRILYAFTTAKGREFDEVNDRLHRFEARLRHMLTGT